MLSLSESGNFVERERSAEVAWKRKTYSSFCSGFAGISLSEGEASQALSKIGFAERSRSFHLLEAASSGFDVASDSSGVSLSECLLR